MNLCVRCGSRSMVREIDRYSSYSSCFLCGHLEEDAPPEPYDEHFEQQVNRMGGRAFPGGAVNQHEREIRRKQIVTRARRRYEQRRTG